MAKTLFPDTNSGWGTPDPRPTTKRAETQAALAKRGLLRKKGQVNNDLENMKKPAPKDIGQVGYSPLDEKR